MSDKAPQAPDNTEFGEQAESGTTVSTHADDTVGTEPDHGGIRASDAPNSNQDSDHSKKDIPSNADSTDPQPIALASIKGRSWPRMAALATVLVLALLIGMGLVYVQQQRQWFDNQLIDFTDQMATQQASLDNIERSFEQRNQANLEQLSQQLNPVQIQLAQFKQLIEQQSQLISQLQQRLDGQQQRLLSMSTTSREDWLLAEAEYLLKLANQRVLLERNPDNAIALLQAADQIVQKVAAGLGDVELFAVRQAIMRELTALKLVPSLDKDGLYLQLQALAEKAGELPRLPSSHLNTSESTEALDLTAAEDPGAEPGWWAQLWTEVRSLGGVLENYIKFSDSETPIHSLVDDHSAQLAALNVRIALEQAQVALLKEENEVYQAALTKAGALIAEYYFPSEARTRFQTSLLALRDTKVDLELPDISASLHLLHAYIERLHQLSPKPEGQL